MCEPKIRISAILCIWLLEKQMKKQRNEQIEE